MENVMKMILKNVDLSKSYWGAYEAFLVNLEENEELNDMFKEVLTQEIEECFVEIYEKFYLPDFRTVEDEIIFDKKLEHTEHNLVYGITKDGTYVIHNLTIGIRVSKTSMNKFLKKYKLGDIDRVRLYCMYHNHVRPDDSFVKDLSDSGIKWKPIKIKNPKRMLFREPNISA